jgi:EpsI family protein
MRGSIWIRVVIAAAIIGLTWLGMRGVGNLTETPPVVMPTWDINDLPKKLGDWTGEDEKLDERLFQATNAKVIVERKYHNEAGTVVSLHFAIFDKPTDGIWHNPMSCYNSAGWDPKDSEMAPITESDPNSDKISLCTWDKSGTRVMVGYWYQLGEHRLYGRWDLGFSVRWKMRGRETWPALIKVLISTSADSKPEATKYQLLNFADQVHKWINQPQHQIKEESVKTESTSTK